MDLLPCYCLSQKAFLCQCFYSCSCAQASLSIRLAVPSFSLLAHSKLGTELFQLSYTHHDRKIPSVQPSCKIMHERLTTWLTIVRVLLLYQSRSHSSQFTHQGSTSTLTHEIADFPPQPARLVPECDSVMQGDAFVSPSSILSRGCFVESAM